MKTLKPSLVMLLVSLAGLACSSSESKPEPTGANALFDTSATRADFFALPWPGDSRTVTDSQGLLHLDLTGFYRPGFTIDGYLDAIQAEPLGGFGTQADIYFRFDAPLDPASLPQSAAASLDAQASVFLVDTTANSPNYGKKTPILVHFNATAGMYIGPNWLALRPVAGFPLRERTTYTAVVTNRVRALDQGQVHRDPRFAQAAAALDAQALGIDLQQVVVATTFTTQDATSIMKDLRTAVYQQAAPTVSDFTHQGSATGYYDEYHGTYQAPNFQEGDPPYLTSGGHLHLGPDGKPAAVRQETLRFALTVPQGEMPAGGWPVVLYAHGTGGDYRSFIDDGSARQAAQVKDRQSHTIGRLAMISIDQVLHGPRDPTQADPNLTFFNFQNIAAGRDNPKQGGLDDFQLLRLVEGMNIAAAPDTGVPIRFDAERIYFKGHSQGGLTGPLFLAFEPKVKAAVLSGAGAGLISGLLEKTQPVNIHALTELLVGEPVNEDHPLLNLMQTYLESSDPANYGHLFFREPPAGQAPKNIYQPIGLIDHYAPVSTMKTFALTMGLQPVNPEFDPIEGLSLTDLTWADAPVSSNVASGQATGVVCEYEVPNNAQGTPKYDGHFVVFDHPDAVVQSNTFISLHASTGVATLVP